jgi:hypothetical protein
MTHRSRLVDWSRVLVACGALLPGLATAQTSPSGIDSGTWRFEASIYGYLASVGGTATFPVTGTSTDFSVSTHQLLGNLDFAAMGSFDAHKGPWGAFTDVMYFDLSARKSQSRDITIGNVGLPAGTTADLNLAVKQWLWTLAGEYRVVADSGRVVDLLAGTRYLDMTQKLTWTISGNLGPIPAPGRSGSAEVGSPVWDGIVGVKGRYGFGPNGGWFVPFYLDIGAGGSDYTWQGAAGIAYAFQWGELGATWRYLDYKFKSGGIQDFYMSGPVIAFTFHW